VTLLSDLAAYLLFAALPIYGWWASSRIKPGWRTALLTAAVGLYSLCLLLLLVISGIGYEPTTRGKVVVILMSVLAGMGLWGTYRATQRTLSAIFGRKPSRPGAAPGRPKSP
jgi:hypothetical protein